MDHRLDCLLIKVVQDNIHVRNTDTYKAGVQLAHFNNLQTFDDVPVIKLIWVYILNEINIILNVDKVGKETNYFPIVNDVVQCD